MSETKEIPSIVYAVASVKSQGEQSLFEAPHLVTSDNVENFYSDPDLIDTAINRLSTEGFEVLHVSPIAITIAAPLELYEQVFKTKIIPVEKEVKRLNDVHKSTFLDTTDTDMPGLIDVSKSAFSDILEGIAIEEPRFRLGSLVSDVLIEVEKSFIEKNQPTAYPPPKSYWHLNVPSDVSLGLNADKAHRAGITGRNVKVVMIDSGWYKHPFFSERGYHFNDVVPGPAATNLEHDESGHGTGESANIFAVAPDIDFTMVKTTFKLVTGHGDIEKAIDLKPDIISISWGSDPPDMISAANIALSAAVARAVKEGITVVCSSGNGQRSFPGQHPDVISAGGTYMHADGTFEATPYASGFSSRLFPGRNCPDVCGLVGMLPKAAYIMLPVEPKDEIDTVLSGGTHPNGDETLNNDGWAAFSGTSAAAPQLAGVCALIKQAAPDLSPMEIRDILKNTARDVTQGIASKSTGSPRAMEGVDLATGHGLADAYQAVKRVLSNE